MLPVGDKSARPLVGVSAHFLFFSQIGVGVTDTTDRVRALAAPIVDRHGLDLLSVEVKAGRGPGLVRLVVDAKGGAGLALCQEVSREVSRRLDDEDPISGQYALEVSSPGLDWPLRHQRDFDRVEGRDVTVCYRIEEEHLTQVTGRVLAAESNAVRLATDKGEHHVRYDAVVWAKQTLPW